MRKTDTPTYPAYHEPWNLEPHYSHHVGAMTSEGLHDKADIAFQLALRDKKLYEQRDAIAHVIWLLEGLPAQPITIRDQRHRALFDQEIERLRKLVPDWEAVVVGNPVNAGRPDPARNEASGETTRNTES